MKNKRLYIIVMAILCGLCLFAPSAAMAKSRGKLLKKGRTYKIDLNGGAKERVKYTTKDLPDYRQQMTLTVNGKKVYKKTVPYDAVVSDVYVADINKKDKTKELVVNLSGNFSDWYFMVLRYGTDKKVKCYYRQKGFITSGRVGVDADEKVFKGNGTFYATADTPFYTDSFGCYYARIPAKLSSGKIQFMRASSYTLAKLDDYVEYTFGEPYYILAVDMDLCSEPDPEKTLDSIKGGTRFTPLAVHPMGTVEQDEMVRRDLMVKIRTSDGVSGWLFFPAFSEEQYLTNIPQWG